MHLLFSHKAVTWIVSDQSSKNLYQNDQDKILYMYFEIAKKSTNILQPSI